MFTRTDGGLRAIIGAVHDCVEHDVGIQESRRSLVLLASFFKPFRIFLGQVIMGGRARHRAEFFVIFPIILLFLTACGTPRGVLAPVKTSQNTSTVEMLVATTRGSASNAGEMFSGQRAAKASFADIVVSIPPAGAHKVGMVEWPHQLPGNPATDFVTVRADVIDQTQALQNFHRVLMATPGRRVLVFVHGFNNRFEEAVFRFAQIMSDARAPVVPVLFTWPSRGSLLAYGYDRESTSYSRSALEKLLHALAQDREVAEISILAHSMGNWLALESLRQMAIREGHVPPKIRNILLAAPDVDVDLAMEAVHEMGPQRPTFTLFAATDDRALAVSRRVWGDSVRLGAISPNMEPYQSELKAANIKVIDITKYKAGDALNHAKFADSPEVVRMIGQRLADGQTLTDSHASFGTKLLEVTAGTANVIGSAASLAVAAPVSIIDPQTRDSMEERAEGLERSVGDTASSAGAIAVQQP